MKKILFILFCSPMFVFGQATVGLLVNLPEAYNGYTLFNSSGSKTTYLIDNCGYKVHEWISNFKPGLSVYLLNNGRLVRTTRLSNTILTGGGSGGGIEILDFNSNVVWSYQLNNDSTLQHHDIEILPNGNILVLAWELIKAQEADAHGSLISADRYSEMILEIDTSNSQIVWEWHAWDHLIQDVDSTLPNYGIISDSPERININYNISNLSNNPDWIHANSLDYNPDLDQIIINCASFSEFWIIDHSTTIVEASDSIGGFSGKGGDILYRWGNPQTYNRGTSADRLLDFQHDAHWIESGLLDAGKIMIFNNGQQRGYSSIEIILPPLDTNNFNNYTLNNNIPYAPQNIYWSYSDSINFFSAKISGSQQLNNGNILICSGNQGKLFEVDYYTDSLVWDYRIPISGLNPVAQGTILTSGNNCFRAHRFSPTYFGLNGLSLTPSTVIELNPLPSNCQIYISGCLDSSACNYDPLANTDDSSCVYTALHQQSISICNGDSILVGSNYYTVTGTYLDTLSLFNGCDSIIYTNLVVEKNSYSYDTLLTNSSVFWNGMTLSVSGTYTFTLTNSSGCDSTANLNLTINPLTLIYPSKTYKRTLVRVIDILGQETPYKRNYPLFYLYDDGKVEKRIIME